MWKLIMKHYDCKLSVIMNFLILFFKVKPSLTSEGQPQRAFVMNIGVIRYALAKPLIYNSI